MEEVDEIIAASPHFMGLPSPLIQSILIFLDPQDVSRVTMVNQGLKTLADR